MSWQRQNIGSRVNREVHARFWERLGVKLLRATRQFARRAEADDHVVIDRDFLLAPAELAERDPFVEKRHRDCFAQANSLAAPKRAITSS
jgi:hypothetical protein